MRPASCPAFTPTVHPLMPLIDAPNLFSADFCDCGIARWPNQEAEVGWTLHLVPKASIHILSFSQEKPLSIPATSAIAVSSWGLIARDKQRGIAELRNWGLEMWWVVFFPSALTADEIFIQESFILLYFLLDCHLVATKSNSSGRCAGKPTAPQINLVFQRLFPEVWGTLLAQ